MEDKGNCRNNGRDNTGDRCAEPRKEGTIYLWIMYLYILMKCLTRAVRNSRVFVCVCVLSVCPSPKYVSMPEVTKLVGCDQWNRKKGDSPIREMAQKTFFKALLYQPETGSASVFLNCLQLFKPQV